jgi:hypothetical protein
MQSQLITRSGSQAAGKGPAEYSVLRSQAGQKQADNAGSVLRKVLSKRQA